MEDLIIKTIIKHCRKDELSAEEQALIESAVRATGNSYAPYSKFNVGAALLLENGETVIGANQENAAFSVTMCAERSAIFNAQSNHPELAIEAIAITARNKDGLVDEPTAPCGVCRQAILEMEQRYHRDIRIYLYGGRGVYVAESIKALLPLCFTDDSMH